jgi:hypothetical protein
MREASWSAERQFRFGPETGVDHQIKPALDARPPVLRLIKYEFAAAGRGKIEGRLTHVLIAFPGNKPIALGNFLNQIN